MKRDIKELEKFEQRLQQRSSNYRKVKTRSLLQRIFMGFLEMIHWIIEVVIALLIIPWILPAWIILFLRKLIKGNPIWENLEIFDRSGRRKKLARFGIGSRTIRNLPLFIHVILGDLSLIGVSLKNYEDRERVLGDAFLFENKPGIINLWFIRESSKTDYEGRLQTEYEYLHKRYPLKDFILLLHFIPAMFFRQDETEFSDSIVIFDIEIVNISMADTIAYLKEIIMRGERKRIYFVNPDCLNKSLVNEAYCKVLQQSSDMILGDGIGIVIASKIMKTPLIQNVNGTDLLPFLCEMSVNEGYGIYLLGAKPGIADAMKANLIQRYPGINIAGTQHGYFDRDKESEEVIKTINKSRAEILLVAFGAPWQEMWIAEHYDKINQANLLIGVGGLFDFYSQTKKRAPRWMRQIGMEWVFRLILEPGRMWKRYILGNPHFLAQVVKYNYMRKYR